MLCRLFEPCHEIMALFVFHKPIFQTHMHSHLVELDVWFFMRSFVCFHASCVLSAKTLVRLYGCAGSPEHSLVAFVISTEISWAGSFLLCIVWDLLLIKILTECRKYLEMINAAGFCIVCWSWCCLRKLLLILFQLCLSLAQEYDQIRSEYWNYVNRTLSSKYGSKTEIQEQIS